ncbi:hypothetical protein SAMN05880590_1226 [Rhizobium sp. RU35A]|uniref:ABC-three component system protein n=1 Tax=Rhizobium sp. RU35A TaxID=1907414 RepID=UPI0009546D56|nr:ABC-three component system protein [Rhizobium sp. RU35A]SIR38347.1 hypothetical protein SAMN05880590_1226 [Rhizobium sp. RU35A]
MSVAPAVVKHSAPGPYLGYALQPVRLCVHLLTAPPKAKVSLELIDDVAVHYADGTICLEQVKSATRQNPLSDWAPDLWKAIANWLTLISQGKVKRTEASYRLYVTPIRHGKRASQISQAASDEDVAKVLKAIAQGLQRFDTEPACMTYLRLFLEADEADKVAILKNLTIVSQDQDPVDVLRAIVAPTVDPPLVDLICRSAIGLAKEQADSLIRAGKHAVLDADEFKTLFRSFVRRNNMLGYLTSLAEAPEDADVDAMLEMRPTFVRQLELIDLSQEDRFRAVSDYLRTSADKTLWAESGLIFGPGMAEWDQSLIRRHSAFAGEVADLHSDHSEEVRGRLIYRRCSVLDASLDGRGVPGHFVNGSYNALADTKRVGWHPRYSTLLGEDL